ncbi:DUF2264 domain-containing protein [Saliphagus sp. LR7]|uniref:DUF2264 domain-containing protein n=1 Tax=Saliphagus sp. LR7 TaxID=2282654 RepID=UPI000DF8124F|nr:DUF2264 domain-containing protein [Saliphagus sp. LR7]
MNPIPETDPEMPWTRSDVQELVRRLVAPLEAHASPGGARVRPGETGASFPDREAELEGFARPLWGLAPLAAGGGEFEHWDRYREGLRHGTDPTHSEYWEPISDYSQAVVELAPIGVALALAGDKLWEPLSADDRDRITDWIRGVEDVEIPDSNWRWFRVLALAGLRSVGVEVEWSVVQTDLDRLESFGRADGWYVDGPDGACDYYAAWELHTNALLYATLAGERGVMDAPNKDRLAGFSDRADRFAEDFRHWFADDGSALPYGRSLTYRFAQAAFWGGLAVADRDPLPWAEIRGLWERTLRWWLDQPIFTDRGVLSLGYRYPTLKTTEIYNSPSSPYWAMKAFLPLTLPESHPFWRAEPDLSPADKKESVLGRDLDHERTMETPSMVVTRAEGEVTALVAGTDTHYPHKYDKFAYSTAFGFGVGSDLRGVASAGIDGTLGLGEDGEHLRVRENVEGWLEDGLPRSRWEPWPDVSVESWLVPATPWHVRVHRLETDRPLHSVEGGFPVARPGEADAGRREEEVAAVVRYPAGHSVVRDLSGDREGEVIDQDPNTNVLHPRTAVPVLRGRHESGTSWLVTAVLGATELEDSVRDRPPVLIDDGLQIKSADGKVLFERE